MTSSSSLYGTVTTQNTSSTNSTSLYGEAGSPIPDASGNVIVRGDLWVLSGNILTTATTGNIFPANATTINLGLAATTVNIGASTGNTYINNLLNAPDAKFGNITIAVASDNTISTTTGNLILTSATGDLQLNPETSILYSESNDRLNRPTFQSTSGNTSGLRVTAPNTGTSAQSNFSVNNSSDSLNTEFLNMSARGSALTDPFRFFIGKYTAGVLGAANKSISFVDNTNVFATVNPAGPTIGTDLTTKDYVDSNERNTTYTIDASTTTGGANFNLVGSDATTDTIKYASGTGITVSRTDANTITVTNAGVTSITGTANQVIASSSTGAITLSLPQSIATTSNPVFAGATLGAIKVGVTTDNTIDTTSGNLVIAPATGIITVSAPTTIQYAENNTRTNRIQFQSSSGNSSGVRVLAPNATTSAQSTLGAFSSNDNNNGSFINLRAFGGGTNPLRIYTGTYTAGVLGASSGAAFVDNVTTYATVNPSGPTIGTDLTTKTYVDGLAPGGVTSVTGTANQVIVSSPTGAVTLSLPQDIDTTSNVTFGAVTADLVFTDEVRAKTDNINVTTQPGNKASLGLSENVSYPDGLAVITVNSNGWYFADDGRTQFPNYTFPAADGSADQVLKTDGSGNLSWYSPSDLNTTYTYTASSTTDGANLTLTGSDATTNTVKLTNAGHITATYTSGTEVTLGSDATTTATASVLVARDANANVSNNATFNGFTSVAASASLITLTASSTPDYLVTGSGGQVIQLPNATTLPNGAIFSFNNNQSSGTISVNNNSATLVISVPSGGLVNVILLSNAIAAGSWDIHTQAPSNVSWSTNTLTYPGSYSSSTGNVTANSTTIGSSVGTVSTSSGNLTLNTANGTGSSGSIVVTAGANGNITLTPNGSGKVVTGVANLADMSYVLGQLIATPTTAYTPPASALTTVTGTNGLAIASSTGNGAAVAVRYFSGDTTAGVNSSANISVSGASGTSTSPGGNALNQVMGTMGFDGYTAGTSNNYASQIATINQGAGTTAISPLQAQGYARQAFTNSTTVTTTVTGASGTGTTATLTFTAQNTAPYVVGQTVAIAGMTPSGYNNAAAVITVATTSSISYANTTTGFTSGGTITAANTVTAAGMGFRVRGFANSTNMTVANRINFMDLTSSAAAFKSNTYTFADEVITGTTLTSKTYMSLGATVGTVNQDTFTVKNTAATSTYASFAVTVGTVNQDTLTLKNTAATTTYATFASGGATIGGVDNPSTFTRVRGASAGTSPSLLIKNSNTVATTPASGDGTTFRLSTAGSNATVYTIADIAATYNSGGDNSFLVQVANGDQTTGSFTGVTLINSKVTATTISAGTASGTAGGSTVATKLTVDANKITATVPFVFPNYTIAAAGAITGAVGWQIAISDSPVAAGRMAYWSTTATAGWRYIDTNLAI